MMMPVPCKTGASSCQHWKKRVKRSISLGTWRFAKGYSGMRRCGTTKRLPG